MNQEMILWTKKKKFKNAEKNLVYAEELSWSTNKRDQSYVDITTYLYHEFQIWSASEEFD